MGLLREVGIWGLQGYLFKSVPFKMWIHCFSVEIIKKGHKPLIFKLRRNSVRFSFRCIVHYLLFHRTAYRFISLAF